MSSKTAQIAVVEQQPPLSSTTETEETPHAVLFALRVGATVVSSSSTARPPSPNSQQQQQQPPALAVSFCGVDGIELSSGPVLPSSSTPSSGSSISSDQTHAYAWEPEPWRVEVTELMVRALAGRDGQLPVSLAFTVPAAGDGAESAAGARRSSAAPASRGQSASTARASTAALAAPPPPPPAAVARGSVVLDAAGLLVGDDSCKFEWRRCSGSGGSGEIATAAASPPLLLHGDLAGFALDSLSITLSVALAPPPPPPPPPPPAAAAAEPLPAAGKSGAGRSKSQAATSSGATAATAAAAAQVVAPPQTTTTPTRGGAILPNKAATPVETAAPAGETAAPPSQPPLPAPPVPVAANLATPILLPPRLALLLNPLVIRANAAKRMPCSGDGGGSGGSSPAVMLRLCWPPNSAPDEQQAAHVSAAGRAQASTAHSLCNAAFARPRVLLGGEAGGAAGLRQLLREFPLLLEVHQASDGGGSGGGVDSSSCGTAVIELGELLPHRSSAGMRSLTFRAPVLPYGTSRCGPFLEAGTVVKGTVRLAVPVEAMAAGPPPPFCVAAAAPAPDPAAAAAAATAPTAGQQRRASTTCSAAAAAAAGAGGARSQQQTAAAAAAAAALETAAAAQSAAAFQALNAAAARSVWPAALPPSVLAAAGGGGFHCAAFVLRGSDAVNLIKSVVCKHNAIALGVVAPPPQLLHAPPLLQLFDSVTLDEGAQQTLSAAQLDGNSTSSADVITGFHLASAGPDGDDEHVVVLEAAAGYCSSKGSGSGSGNGSGDGSSSSGGVGGMPSGLDVVRALATWTTATSGTAERGAPCRALFTTTTPPQPLRSYATFGVALRTITLCSGIERLAGRAAAYGRHVRPEVTAGIARLAALRAAQWARHASEMRLWPSAAELECVERKFGCC